jgi:hypothetical protein
MSRAVPAGLCSFHPMKDASHNDMETKYVDEYISYWRSYLAKLRALPVPVSPPSLPLGGPRDLKDAQSSPRDKQAESPRGPLPRRGTSPTRGKASRTSPRGQVSCLCWCPC